MRIFAEPAPTKYDVRFSVAGIPVRVHPLFWVATLFLSLNPSATLLSVALWLPCVFVSILVHELGHGLAIRHYGLDPRISLYSLGGLAVWEEGWRKRSPREDVIIAAAGPAAGFLLAALVVLTTWRLGYQVNFLGWTLIDGAPLPNLVALLVVHDLLVINLLWGAMNLVPVQPLDGSHIFHGLFFAGDALHGAERSLRLSVWSGIGAALLSLVVLDSVVMGLMFAWLAFSSQVVLSAQYDGSAFVLPRWATRLRKRWREREQARVAREATERRRAADAQVRETLARVEADDAEEIAAELADTARDLLTRLNEDLARERARRPKAPAEPGDDEGRR